MKSRHCERYQYRSKCRRRTSSCLQSIDPCRRAVAAAPVLKRENLRNPALPKIYPLHRQQHLPSRSWWYDLQPVQSWPKIEISSMTKKRKTSNLSKHHVMNAILTTMLSRFPLPLTWLLHPTRNSTATDPFRISARSWPRSLSVNKIRPRRPPRHRPRTRRSPSSKTTTRISPMPHIRLSTPATNRSRRRRESFLPISNPSRRISTVANPCRTPIEVQPREVATNNRRFSSWERSPPRTHRAAWRKIP